MKREALVFDRPSALQATAPPEARGVARDGVRLMVSTAAGHVHAHFYEMARFLAPGDLLIFNRSATLPASLPAGSTAGSFVLNLSTHFGGDLWLAEPRKSADQPGPLPLVAGEWLHVAGRPARLVAPYPAQPRLWFVRMDGAAEVMAGYGSPIRYGYLAGTFPLDAYQTIFADVPGSAEMPSAGRPFTARVVTTLRDRGVTLAGLVLHTGVSSLEVDAEEVEQHPLPPESFCVSPETARAVNAARREGRRVIAVGTTVVRALESAWDTAARQVRAVEGFTRLYIHPGRRVQAVDGILTGLHDPLASHLAMLYAIAGQPLVRSAYAEAVRAGYLWHEFGDSHLILPSSRP